MMVDRVLIRQCLDYLAGTVNPLPLEKDDQSNTELSTIPQLPLPVSTPGEQWRVDLNLIWPRLASDLCWSLACDITEHLFPLWITTFGADDRLHEVIHLRRTWLAGNRNQDLLERGKQVAYELMKAAIGNGTVLAVAACLAATVSVNRDSHRVVSR